VTAGLPGKMLRSSVAILTAFVGLLSLSGCQSEGYPENLVYPLRTDPLPITTPSSDAPGFDRPGEFPEVLFAGLKPEERSKLLGYPNKMDEGQREELDKALTRIFGTPAHPRVDAGSEAGDALKQLSQDLQLDEETLALGSSLYRHQCLHCHGLTGDGRGPTAPWVNPHPRDYRLGRFKYTSSSQEEGKRKPRREDLVRTVREGIEGSSMPSFRLLPDNDLEALASYVIHLSLRGRAEYDVMKVALSPEGLDQSVDATVMEFLTLEAGQWLDAQAPKSLIQPGPHPNVASEQEMKESIARGFGLFVRKNPEGNNKAAGCLGCHTDFGRQSAYKYDVWGTIVRPVDLTTGIYHGGRRPIDLYWRIYSGINGANMPASKENLESKDIWDLVNFLQVLPYPKMREKYGINLESSGPAPVAARPDPGAAMARK
jgi:mono/diheme cytochrome c family protein